MGFPSRIFGRGEEPTHSKDGDCDMVSLVVLAPSWQPWSTESVRAELDALFPGQFLPPREAGNFVIDGPIPDATYLVQCTVSGYAGMFLIHNVPGPYSAFSDFLPHIEDPDLRRLAAEQPCWLSVDSMHRHTSDEEAVRFVAAVTGTLAPADSVLLVHPSRYLTARFTRDIRATLVSGRSPFGTV